MGLDDVELIMDCEEIFAVKISDQEASQCDTPRKIIDMIYDKVKNIGNDICRSQQAFNNLRKYLVQEFDFNRKDIKLSTPLETIFPEDVRYLRFKKLEKYINKGCLPLIQRNSELSIVIKTLAVILYFAALLLAISGFNFFLMMFIAFIIHLSTLYFTRKFKPEFQDGLNTIRDIMNYVVCSDINTAKWTRGMVADVVKDSVLRISGINPAEYYEDAHLYRDLGFG